MFFVIIYILSPSVILTLFSIGSTFFLGHTQSVWKTTDFTLRNIVDVERPYRKLLNLN